MKIERLAWLDILRFLAAMMVFVFHTHNKKIETLTPFINIGGVGVAVFFLISGYIIPTMLHRYKSMKDFLINRFFRLFPLFLFFVFIAKVKDPSLNISGIILPFADFWNANYLLGGLDWTLRIEWWYYILTCIVFYQLNLSTKKIFFLCVLLSSIAIIFHTVFQNLLSQIITSIVFVVYIYIGWMLCKRKYLNASILTLISLATLAIITPTVKYFNSTKYALVAFIVFTTFYFFRSKIKPTKLTTTLGNLTYPLYLSHMIFYPALIKFFKYHIVSFFILLFICYLLHRFIEKPCINYGKRFVK